MRKLGGWLLVGLGGLTAFDSFWELAVSGALVVAGVVVMHLEDE